MPGEEIHGITSQDWPEFQQLMRDYRAGRLGAGSTAAPAAPAAARPAPPSVMMLMGNLETDGVVTAERLQYRDEFEGWDLQVLGAVSGLNSNFWLTFNGQQTRLIPYLASAQDVGDALYEVAGNALVDVTIGNRIDEGYFPMRWRLAFAPRDPATGQTWNLSVSSSRFLLTRTRYHGTDLFETVHSAVPVGEPTPLRSGAQVACLNFPGSGWGVIAAEARRYQQLFQGGDS